MICLEQQCKSKKGSKDGVRGMATEDHDGFWNHDEFEDFVAMAIIGLYETDNLCEAQKSPKGMELRRSILPCAHDINMARRIGAYFPPDDRWVYENGFDINVDGIPEVGAMAGPGYVSDVTSFVSGNLDMTFLWKIPRLPRGWVANAYKPIAIYRMLAWLPQDAGGSWIITGFSVMRKNGDMVAARELGWTPQGDNLARILKRESIRSSTALQFWADRRHLWNVEAKEHEAKATFGVYEEQIKSLFYMRSLPTTATGRKRPILHWVRAHQRRLREGIEIDVERHLRGVTEFEMNGTAFRITSPVKPSH